MHWAAELIHSCVSVSYEPSGLRPQISDFGPRVTSPSHRIRRFGPALNPRLSPSLSLLLGLLSHTPTLEFGPPITLLSLLPSSASPLCAMSCPLGSPFPPWAHSVRIGPRHTLLLAFSLHRTRLTSTSSPSHAVLYPLSFMRALWTPPPRLGPASLPRARHVGPSDRLSPLLPIHNLIAFGS